MTVAKIDTRDYFTCPQAGAELDLSADSVRVYCNNALDGRTPALRGIKVGRDWLIPKSEIQRYKRERVGRGRPAAKS